MSTILIKILTVFRNFRIFVNKKKNYNNKLSDQGDQFDSFNILAMIKEQLVRRIIPKNLNEKSLRK